MNWRETPATLSRARDEQPVVFTGPKGALYGILTPPAPDAPPARACVVFPGRPRAGLRRHLVLAARILAADGFAVLRFDLRGRGESSGEVARPSRHDPLGDDVVAAIRHLREAHGQTAVSARRLLLRRTDARSMHSRKRPARSPACSLPLQLCSRRSLADRQKTTAPAAPYRACVRWSGARLPQRYWRASRMPFEHSRDRMRAHCFSTQNRTRCERSFASPRKFCSRNSTAKRANASQLRSGPAVYIPSRARPSSSSVRSHGSASFIPHESSATPEASRTSQSRRSLSAVAAAIAPHRGCFASWRAAIAVDGR